MNKTTQHPINNFFQSLPMDIFNRHETKSPSWLISDTPKSRLAEITPQLGEELLSRNTGSNIHQERMMKTIAATRAFLDKKAMKLLRASYNI